MVPLPYHGIWRRDWIDRYDDYGAPNREYRPAIWFQSRHYHVDLRVDPNLAHKTDTTQADVFEQTQIAFAGSTVVSNSEGREICQWHPSIAYPRLSEEVDAGFMHFASATHLMEQGLDGSYQESWQRLNGEGEAIRCLRFALLNGDKKECFLMLCGSYFALGSNYAGTANLQLPVYAWGERHEHEWVMRESLAPWHAGKRIDIDQSLIDATAAGTASTADWTLPLMPTARWRLLEVD